VAVLLWMVGLRSCGSCLLRGELTRDAHDLSGEKHPCRAYGQSSRTEHSCGPRIARIQRVIGTAGGEEQAARIGSIAE